MQRLRRGAYWFPLFWLGYLGMVGVTSGLRWEHLALVSALLGLYLAHPKTRQWTVDFFPFAVFAILYDFLRLYPKEWAGAIHIVEPYQLEAALFGGLGFLNGLIPTEFFSQHHHPILDVLTGLIYGFHVLVPIGFAVCLWFRRSPAFSGFRWAFFFMNLAAFATYIAYPAAPPWYVTEFGFENLGWEAPASAAALVRFDAFFGIEHFQNTYGRSSWVFGAIPSMHAGFPLLVALFARRIMGRVSALFFVYAGLAAFAAVYLNHHYVIDLLAGWVFALGFFKLFSLSPVRVPVPLPTISRASEDLAELPE